MKVKNFTQTCGACPSQWEGMLEDGRTWYARYRWGVLSVSVSQEPTLSHDAAISGPEVINEEIGGDLDGVMSTEELKEVMIQNGFSFVGATELV